MGNFMEILPTPAALDAAQQLIAELERRNYVNRSCWSFYGHRDKGETACPGTELYKEFGTWPNWHQECSNFRYM